MVRPKVTLLKYTSEPEKLVAAAAKLCYSSKADIDSLLESLTEDKVESFVKKLESLGHESPFEHVSFTFGIEGVSRAFLAQQSRHRHQSMSVCSQRYVLHDSVEFLIPKSIENNEKAKQEFLQLMEQIRQTYGQLIELGIPKEDARSVLPNSTPTKMIVTFNVRALWNFFHLRCCTRAQREIRLVANEMLRLCKEAAPLLFEHAGASCVKGYCPEGSMCCGKAPVLEELLKAFQEVKDKERGM